MITSVIFIAAVLGAVGARIAVIRMFDTEKDPVLRQMIRKNVVSAE